MRLGQQRQTSVVVASGTVYASLLVALHDKEPEKRF